MKQKIRIILLGIYDFILAYGAISHGLKMISEKGGYSEYPKEWLTKVPFESWVVPGIIAIGFFGVGNIIAGFSSFFRKSNISWLMSTIMGGIFFVSLIFQVKILGETYLATGFFFIFSIIQLCLSWYVFLGFRKNLKSSKV